MIQLKQIKKDMFSAYFQIIDTETREVPVKIQGKSETMTQYSKVIGGVWVEGKLGSMEAKVHIEMFGKNFDLNFNGYGYHSTHLDEKTYKVFRQYEILENGGLMGKIHQVDLKRSWLRISSYLELQYGDDLLEAYGVSKGTDAHTCIYQGEEQIAQIEKSTIIHNDLHSYDIYASDQLSAIEAVLFSVYGYVISCFKPGEKVTKSYCKYYHTTTDPFLLSKYHPEFLRELEEKKSET
ncbi:hypothetical protein LKD72_12610 [Fusicatenibacter sp. CLA-AA-H213]|nr:hypothetical protein [Fusicatenibacter sp. CLA-AA-H213]